jgi:DNA-binding FrmR family transcriptional regulator
MSHLRTGHVHPEEDKKRLLLRLKKISGQVAGIQKMIENGEDCPDVLMQVVAVRKALKSFGQEILHAHTHECIEHAADAKEGHRKLTELLAVIERYTE